MGTTRGRFIVVEGGDGAGKSTQIELLADALDAHVTAEPGGTALGQHLRALMLAPGADIDVRAEALMMAADRAQHVATVLEPALAAGRDVICSRFSWSSFAYQGAGRGLGVEAIAAIDAFARNGLTPDVTLLLDINPDLGARRRGDRAPEDRIELAGDAFHRTVRAAMLDLARSDPRAEVVDAAGTREQVHARVLAVLSRHGITPAA